MAQHYLKKILSVSDLYLKKSFSKGRFEEFIKSIEYIYNLTDRKNIVKNFSDKYVEFIKEDYQRQYQGTNEKLNTFLEKKNDGIKIIWGDCLNVTKGMKSESIHCMVTSPPYYNAREYSIWKNLDDYLRDMRNIIKEAYRILDNHRVFVFNVGDIFDNDNLTTQSVWGKRRLPLGAYFIKIFEEEGFTFVDDFIWDKGEVQSERHKHGDKPYPFYQYPANCYEHILIFHKHRLDDTRYPCPICGTLKVNGNTQSEIGLRSWECKNLECFERSKSNRGKRFSLKTLTTQSSQKKEHEIPEEFIKKWRRDIIKFSPVIKINAKGENTLGHTAPFPENIPEFAIRMFSYENEKILDPFGGSFTSVIVAKKLNRIGIGIELNKKMFRDASIKNIKSKFTPDLFNQKNVKISEYDYEK
ncbi:MAG: site-specific DNA-methyltransferase [bacterium]